MASSHTNRFAGAIGQAMGSALAGPISPELAAYLRSLDQQPVDLSFLNDLYPQDSGYGYSGSYGGGYAAPAVQPILETSPEWTAYLNALGLERQQFAADIERQRALAKSQTEYNLSQVKPQYDEQRRGITASAEGRGMARSGEFQRDLATNKAAEARTRAGIQQGLDSSLSNLESQLAQKNMDLAAREAQQRATMIGQGYRSDPGALPNWDWNALAKVANPMAGTENWDWAALAKLAGK